MNWFKRLLETVDPEKKYLEASTDICDLERRLKNIQRGSAPYQLKDNYSHRGVF